MTQRLKEKMQCDTCLTLIEKALSPRFYLISVTQYAVLRGTTMDHFGAQAVPMSEPKHLTICNACFLTVAGKFSDIVEKVS